MLVDLETQTKRKKDSISLPSCFKVLDTHQMQGQDALWVRGTGRMGCPPQNSTAFTENTEPVPSQPCPAPFTHQATALGEAEQDYQVHSLSLAHPWGAESAPIRLLSALLGAGLGSSLPRVRPGCRLPPAQMPLQLFQPPPTLAGSFSHHFSSLNCFQKGFCVQEPGGLGGLGNANPTQGELRAGGLPSHKGGPVMSRGGVEEGQRGSLGHHILAGPCRMNWVIKKKKYKKSKHVH